MYGLIRELYPVCRSITGNGLRSSLSRIGQDIPLAIHEVATGTTVFDWTVPREWNIRDAWVKNSRGEKVIDFQKHSLHVVNYSVAVHRRLELSELKAHLYTLPDHPDWIPYRTSYYQEAWGFCLADRELLGWPDGEYEVLIDSTLEAGSLSYGECYLPGETSEEILISAHSCHPSLCNDNLSGMALAASLARLVSGAKHRYSYRFLFIPGTIGSITWLSRNNEAVSRVKHGLVLACVGDRGAPSYKKSRRSTAEIDRVAAYLLGETGGQALREFTPYGYDERQYCSPGFDLPVGCFSRTPHGRFPEYHSSADNLDFVDADSLADSLLRCLSIFAMLEENRCYLNLNPKCEPQLGKRGLYRAMGGLADAGFDEMAMLWVLNLSDGSRSLLDIAERSGVAFDSLHAAAQALEAHGLLSVPGDPAERRAGLATARVAP